MKMLKALLLPLVLFGVMSCIDAAPRSDTPQIVVERRINSWRGAPVSKIIASWGAPNQDLYHFW